MPAGEFSSATKTYYVGSDAFHPNENSQQGTLTLTHQRHDEENHMIELKDQVKVTLTSIEVVQLAPLVRDEDGKPIPESAKPNWGRPITPFVEEDPYVNRIAHRELKVRIGSPAMSGKKVTWKLGELPGATPATIRGKWTDSPIKPHKNAFEESATFGKNNFKILSGTERDAKAETTVGPDGHTAIRVNVPPIGFNQARIQIQVEGIDQPFNLLDMEVPAVIVIDPGHGGRDSGAVGRTDKTVLEKDLALTYGLKIREDLIKKFKDKKRGLRIIMTRKDDIFIGLYDRSPFAKKEGSDIFVSIHFNSGASSTARGTETFVQPPPTNVNLKDDQTLASALQAATLAAVGNDAVDRGVKQANYVVIKDGEKNNGNTKNYQPVKSCLVEVEFLSNETALNSVKLPGETGEKIKNAFAKSSAADIFNNIINQP